MKFRKSGAAIAIAAMLSACGGDDGGSGAGISSGGAATGTTVNGCSLAARQEWVAQQLREWYLFPETLPTNLNQGAYTTIDDYIDALTATARGQSKDRYFTHITSIREENAYYQSGASAGFGLRFTLDASQTRLMIAEAFEGGPGLAAGIDRGAELVGIGTTTGNVRSIRDIVTANRQTGLEDALGPDTAGTMRVLRIAANGTTRDISVTKTDFALQPVSPRYGTQIINDEGRRVGYLNLRTFINTADPQLRAAFATFKQQGVTDVVIDLRYNGGGLIDTAELFSDLLGGARQSSEVQSYTSYRPDKASRNTTRLFQPQPESIAPTRIAFIGTGGTASASELVINAAIPYFRANAALIGTNTYGKPVGQIPLDRPECDDRLRVVALATQNADRQGEYYTGLAGFVKASCQAGDDLSRPLGDPQEASLRAALNFLAGRTCTPINTSGNAAARSLPASSYRLLTPTRPTTPQREVPGLF